MDFAASQWPWVSAWPKPQTSDSSKHKTFVSWQIESWLKRKCFDFFWAKSFLQRNIFIRDGCLFFGDFSLAVNFEMDKVPLRSVAHASPELLKTGTFSQKSDVWYFSLLHLTICQKTGLADNSLTQGPQDVWSTLSASWNLCLALTARMIWSERY